MKRKERLERKRQRAKDESGRQYLTTLQEAEKISQDYEAAVLALHGVKVRVLYKNGWFKVGSTVMRRFQLVDKTAILQARLHELELGNEQDY